jgi:DNA end-binding protein Ku
VESLADSFEPERFKDEFRAKVEKLARQKARGKEVVLEERPREPAPVVDLMAALEKSLAASRRPARRQRKTA